MALNERDILNRLIRLESRLVRGFEELGINIDHNADWLSVDDGGRIVYVASLGRSLSVMLTDMARKGATHMGKPYEIVHQGETVGYINFVPPRFR